MSAEIPVTRLIELLLLPPAGPLLLMLAGGLLRLRYPRGGRRLLLGGGALLYAAMTPLVAQRLAQQLEQFPALTPAAALAAQAEAVVVLGADRYYGPEYGGPTSSAAELVRLRYAATLQRLTGLPLAALGGDAYSTPPSADPIMAQVLEEEFLVPVRWRDNHSRNTLDNARIARELLAADGIHRILLVTDALHMPRAYAAFVAQGLQPIPAPTHFHPSHPLGQGWLAWVPQAGALGTSRSALHELVGRLWYRLASDPENG